MKERMITYYIDDRDVLKYDRFEIMHITFIFI